MISLLLSSAWAHGPDASSFNGLDEFWPTPNQIRTATGIPGREYWQQQADYSIQVTLNPTEQQIEGTETIRYTNNSPDTLHYVWMQLDQNYLSNLSARAKIRTAPHLATENTTLNVQTVRALELRPDYEPNLTISDVTVDGVPTTPIIRDTQMRLTLPTALNSGEEIEIGLSWSYQMNDASVLWARSGYERLEDDALIFEVAQFYPRMSIYSDLEGWLTKPYLGTGEFASEFGDFDVQITVPKDYVVGATGTLQNPTEVLSAPQQRRLEMARTSEEPVYIVKPVEAEQNRINTTSKTQTWHFKAENVRDFAWGASNAFVWDAWGREIDGQTVMAMSYYPEEGMPLWNQYSTHAIAHTLEFYSKMVFPYPYPVAISMNGPIYGMEYPMLSFNGPRPLEDDTYFENTGPWKHQKNGLISVIIHEVGHNWFPMIVNNDERSWIWMDEGLNTYVQSLAELEWSEQFEPKRGEPSQISGYMKRTDDVPIMTDAESVTSRGNNAYAKPAAALNLLRNTVVDPELFDEAFAHYSTQWAFKRPYPADFFRSIEDASGTDLDWFWRSWFYGTNHVDLSVDNVDVFVKDVPNPVIQKALQRERDTTKKVNTKRRQQQQASAKYADRYPSVLDFYDTYDPYEVTEKDLEAFESLMAELPEEDKKFFSSQQFYNRIRISNQTGMPSPIIARITYADASTEEIRIPADIWRTNNNSITKLLIRSQAITKVELDPLLETADANLSNNTFPKSIETHSFSVEPKTSPPPNPMQENQNPE